MTIDAPLTKNRAFLAAFNKGVKAARDGLGRKCPYGDHRGGYNNMVTFSRAFQKYWFMGYDRAREESNDKTQQR